MSVVSIAEILERNLIRGREIGDGDGLVEPEGAAVDIRLGEVWEMIPESEAFLYKVERKTKDYKKVAEYKVGESTMFVVKPNVIYQFKAIEEIHVPEDLVARFIARYNLLASGIMILGYKADPGYYGQFQAPAVNLSGVDFEIELGARFAQFEFHRIDGKAVKYRGQWKGGRVNMEKAEVQV